MYINILILHIFYCLGDNQLTDINFTLRNNFISLFIDYLFKVIDMNFF